MHLEGLVGSPEHVLQLHAELTICDSFVYVEQTFGCCKGCNTAFSLHVDRWAGTSHAWLCAPCLLLACYTRSALCVYMNACASVVGRGFVVQGHNCSSKQQMLFFANPPAHRFCMACTPHFIAKFTVDACFFHSTITVLINTSSSSALLLVGACLFP